MTAIRPPIFPPQPTPPGAARPEQARSAAQKAFFEAALGKAAPGAPTAALQSPATAVSPARPQAPAPIQRMPDPAAEKPQKILRPGSLLDIRI